MDDLMNPYNLDTTTVWIKNKHGVVSSKPKYIADELLADKNMGYEVAEPEFVPKKHIKPFDDEKSLSGQKRANTTKTYTEIKGFINQSISELRAYAKANDITLSTVMKKKEILEAIEKAGKLK